MAEVFALIILVFGFAAIMKYVGLVRRSRKVMAVSALAMSTMRAPNIDDSIKEQEMRRYAVDLLILAIQLIFGGAIAVFVPLAVVWGFGAVGLLSFDKVLDMATSTEFLVGTTLVIIVGVWAAHVRK